MRGQHLWKGIIGCAALLIFFQFFGWFLSAALRLAIFVFLAALILLFEGLPAFPFFRGRKQFGVPEAIFSVLFLLQAVFLVALCFHRFSVRNVIFFLLCAAALTIWQRYFLTQRSGR